MAIYLPKYGIYLTLDYKNSQGLKALRKELAEEILGIPNPIHKMDPHITLIIFNNLSQDKAIESFRNISLLDFYSFEISLNKIDAFKGKTNTIYIAPSTSPSLMKLQNYIYKIFSLHSTIAHNSFPSSWIPHCTIMKGLNNEGFIKTKEFIEQHWEEKLATVEKVELINVYRPLEILESRRLNKNC